MTWNEVLLNVVNTFLGLVVTALVPYLFSLLRNKLKAEYQIKYLEKFQDIVTTAVTQVQQTYVSEMRKAGTFDKMAQATAFCKARDAVLAMLNEKTKEIVTEAVGDFEMYMKNKIEEAVYDNKLVETTAE